MRQFVASSQSHDRFYRAADTRAHPSRQTRHTQVWRGHFGDHSDAFVRTFLDSDTALQDLDQAEATYFQNSGVVLVILADGNVVGTGAVLRIDTELCEMKRTFLLREYRGQGWGRQLGEELLQKMGTVSPRRSMDLDLKGFRYSALVTVPNF